MTAPLRFSIDWEPVDAAVRAPDLRATWCRFELWVDGECLTLAEDPTTQSVRHGCSLSMYPVAEWIAFNWWSLSYDGRDDAAPARSARRNLRAAGDGFLWPSCEFLPEGDFTMVRWSGGSPPGPTRLRFLSHGSRVLDTADVQNALSGVVETVITRLDEEGVRETPLHQEWRALQSLDAEEAEFCTVAARLGLDPFSEGVDLADEINAVFEAVEQPIRADFFDSAPAAALAEAAVWVDSALASVLDRGRGKAAFPLSAVDEAVSAASGSDLRPWEVGYSAARSLRQALALGPTTSFPDIGPIGTVSVPRHASFVAAGRRFRDGAAIATTLASPAGGRFAAARALWHAAHATESMAFLLTTGRSASQRAGRAFAAELLAPAAGIRQLLGAHAVKAPVEDIEMVAEEFGVAGLLVTHQIDNQLREPSS